MDSQEYILGIQQSLNKMQFWLNILGDRDINHQTEIGGREYNEAFAQLRNERYVLHELVNGYYNQDFDSISYGDEEEETSRIELNQEYADDDVDTRQPIRYKEWGSDESDEKEPMKIGFVERGSVADLHARIRKLQTKS